jgi:hypothetical protein
MSIGNLFEVFEQCTKSDYEEALGAYYRYNQIMREMSTTYGLSVEIVAAVFSALSPNNDYIGNLRDARKLLQFSRDPMLTIDDFKVSTYGHNKRKAWAVSRGALPPEEAFPSRKTYNFWKNTVDPSNPHFVTIDGHMFHASRGQKGNVVGSRKANGRTSGALVNEKTYDEISDHVKRIAKVVDLIPNQVQAVIWLTYKRIHGKLYSKQTEFFPSDFVAAGIIKLDGKKAK